MAELKFLEVRCGEEKELALLAERLWHSAYDGLLGKTQVDYMVDLLQSAPALCEQIAHGYTYYFIRSGGQTIGFCGVQRQGAKLFLSKLYLSDEFRGRGVGQLALGKVAALARDRGAKSVYLTVNKGNLRAVRAYEKFGFVRTEEQVTDIGNGFVMDDFVYEFTL